MNQSVPNSTEILQQLASAALVLANTTLGFSKPHAWQWGASDVCPANAEKASLP